MSSEDDDNTSTSSEDEEGKQEDRPTLQQRGSSVFDDTTIGGDSSSLGISSSIDSDSLGDEGVVEEVAQPHNTNNKSEVMRKLGCDEEHSWIVVCNFCREPICRCAKMVEFVGDYASD